jgi:hypothetical protein
MPVVRMQDHISGGRWDGREWPPANGTIEVPEWEAKDLIAGRLAVPAGGSTGGSAAPVQQAEAPAHSEPGAGAAAAPSQLPGRPPEPAQSAVPVAPPQVSPLAEVSALAEVGGKVGAQPEPQPQPEQAPAEEETVAAEAIPPGPPSPSDVKQKWIDYGISQGGEPDAVAAMTKADLMSRYGGRL